MKSLLRFFSLNSYVWLALAVGALLLALLARNGLGPLDLGVLALYAAAAVVGQRLLRTPPEQIVKFDALAAFDRVLRDNRPTLLEIYSENCGVCMLMRPVVEKLERDVGHRLQILRVNANDAIGAQIADRYGVTFTPTFLLFSSYGVKEEEFTLVLDRSRVMYWLDQQTITP